MWASSLGGEQQHGSWRHVLSCWGFRIKLKSGLLYGNELWHGLVATSHNLEVLCTREYSYNSPNTLEQTPCVECIDIILVSWFFAVLRVYVYMAGSSVRKASTGCWEALRVYIHIGFFFGSSPECFINKMLCVNLFSLTISWKDITTNFHMIDCLKSSNCM